MPRDTNRLTQKRSAERSSLSRVDKFFKSGRIVAVNTLSHSAVVQVLSGYLDSSGNPIYFNSVPYDPQVVPNIGYTVRLAYDGHSSHSMRILGQGLGGSVDETQLTVNGSSIEIKEIDSSPDITGVKILRVPNGSLTNDGGGQATLRFPYPAGVVALVDAVTILVDASLGDVFEVTLGGSRTLGNPTFATDGQRLLFRIRQDGTGSRVLTLDTNYRLGVTIPAVVLSTAANKTDYLECIYHSGDGKFDVIRFETGY
jgi:hypothetical protein